MKNTCGSPANIPDSETSVLDDNACAIHCHATPRCLAFETKPIDNKNESLCRLKDNQELRVAVGCHDWTTATDSYYILDRSQKQVRFLNDDALKATKLKVPDTPGTNETNETNDFEDFQCPQGI